MESGHKHTAELALKSDLTSMCKIATGNYVGTGADDLEITGLGFDPKHISIFNFTSNLNWIKNDQMGQWYAVSAGVEFDLVCDLITDGFQVNHGQVNDYGNRLGEQYYWTAWG